MGFLDNFGKGIQVANLTLQLLPMVMDIVRAIEQDSQPPARTSATEVISHSPKTGAEKKAEAEKVFSDAVDLSVDLLNRSGAFTHRTATGGTVQREYPQGDLVAPEALEDKPARSRIPRGKKAIERETLAPQKAGLAQQRGDTENL